MGFHGNNFIIALSMGCVGAMKLHYDAISEVSAEILLVGLVLCMGAAIFVIVFGVLPMIPKSAYLATDVNVQQLPGYSVIAITHRGGDSLTFIDPAKAPYFAWVYVDTPVGSYTVVPDATTSPFQPGDRVYIYYNGIGYGLTSNLASVSAYPLPSPDMRVRIVDAASNLLILDWGMGTYGTQKLPDTITPTSTTTVTTTPVNTTAPTPTATVSPTPTNTTAPTPTATATSTSPPSYTISVSWSPAGLGTISPPGTTPGTVTVASGASQTFTFTPNSKKTVLSISLDGSTVSSGGSVGQTLTYTLNNVQSPHSLTATFG